MASFAKVHKEPYPALTSFVSTQPLQHKSVLITGAGRGIGEHIAKQIATAGADRIAILGRDEGRITSAKEHFTQAFPKTTFTAFAADITDQTAVANVFKGLGFVPDILINNAGYFPDSGPFIDEDLKDWFKGFEINVLGTAIVTQQYLRTLRNASHEIEEPIVLTVSSAVAHFRRPLTGWTGYNASKTGQLRVLEYLRFEHPEVRFVNIHPGQVDTDTWAKSKSSTPETGMTHGDVAGQFLVWVATEEAKFLSGRFAWAEWDIDELQERKQEILEKDLLLLTLDGSVRGM